MASQYLLMNRTNADPSNASNVSSPSPLEHTALPSPYKDMPSPGIEGGLSFPTPMSFYGETAPRSPRHHPFAKNFEPPKWRHILIHVVACVVAYPLLTGVTMIAKDKSLFWTRFIVGLGSGLVGFALGLSLLGLGKAFLEAATWATVIHQSHVEGAPGVKLKVLAAGSTDPTSAWAALRLLWDRHSYPGTARKQRSKYDGRRWSSFIVFFLVLLNAAASIPFVLGRLINITTTVRHQRDKYDEVSIAGDNSEKDIKRAILLKPIFDDSSLTWTLAPISTHGGLPPALTFQYQNSLVYFSETTLPQLLPNGSGFGTFNTERVDWANQTSDDTKFKEVSLNPDDANVEPGSILRMPKWGTRLHCLTLPDPKTNLVPSASGFTYLFTPTSVIQSLLESFSMQIPSVLPVFKPSQVLKANDTLPVGVDSTAIAVGGAFPDNGKAHSFLSTPLSQGQDAKGWVTLEHVLVRLNTTFAPNGTFPVLSYQGIPDVTGKTSYIGYDAAVCLQLFEPWIVEVYNSTTGVPSSMRLVGPGNGVGNAGEGYESENVGDERRIGQGLTGVRTELNSSRLGDVYSVAHTNSINQMLKDNGRDAAYVPSQTVVSFTDGRGALGYTSLSPSHLAQARGLADATNILPYFTGTGQTLARRYADRVLSSASFQPLYMGIYLALILIIGITAGLFVPRLPLNVPRRGFELYTWMAAFHAEELVCEASESERRALRNMEPDEIEKAMGELRFRHVNRPL